MEKFKILVDSQFGFRKQHSTKLALADLTTEISKKIDDGCVTLGIFIDLKKAFDTINHNILLSKLQHYGIRGVTLSWFETYLKDRQQYVTVNNCDSNHEVISCGVPQGSTLGPLLFLIYINDISRSSNLFKFRLFADDTNLFHSIKNNSFNFDILNKELHKVSVWCKANKLTINVDKTNLMIFTTAQRKTNVKGTLSIDDLAIEMVSSALYLGVTLESTLGWKPHIRNIVNKISKSIGIITYGIISQNLLC